VPTVAASTMIARVQGATQGWVSQYVVEKLREKLRHVPWCRPYGTWFLCPLAYPGLPSLRLRSGQALGYHVPPLRGWSRGGSFCVFFLQSRFELLRLSIWVPGSGFRSLIWPLRGGRESRKLLLRPRERRSLWRAETATWRWLRWRTGRGGRRRCAARALCLRFRRRG
jgi:hypothetical protein